MVPVTAVSKFSWYGNNIIYQVVDLHYKFSRSQKSESSFFREQQKGTFLAAFSTMYSTFIRLFGLEISFTISMDVRSKG